MKALLLAVLFAPLPEDPHPDLPPLALCRGLPTFEAAQDHLAFAEVFVKDHCRGSWPLTTAWNWHYWTHISVIQDDSKSYETRRRHLSELIDWLGWEAVLSGRIPSAVPLEMIPERPR